MSPAEATPKPKEVEKSRRYECPQDFESSGRRPCGGTLAETLRSGERELWLVKTPAGFDPRCLSGVKVNLCGLQTLTLPSAADAGGNRQVYNILASDHGAADLRLLTADSAVGPAFRGLLSVCESYGAAVAATASPGGLAQGFQPPGSETQEAREDGKTSSKKKKKKDKHVKAEVEDVEVMVKQEVEEPEKKRKKRKKKDREEEELVEVKQEVEDEQEVVDAMDKNDVSAKKKKKKKKSKMDGER